MFKRTGRMGGSKLDARRGHDYVDVRAARIDGQLEEGEGTTRLG